MTGAYLLAVVFLSLLTFLGCGSKIPIASRPPVTDRATHDYQRLFDSVGDHCYPGDQFPANVAHDQLAPSTDLPRQTTGPWLSVNSSEILQAPPPSSYQYLPISLVQTASQPKPAPTKKAVSSVDDLALLSDIDLAKFKDGDLIVIGPPARESDGFRPDDWYTVFRAISGAEAPGVTIDPGPDARLMQVRYFGGIQNTALGNTFFEADRTLKLLSTGFDNFTCSFWPARPSNVPTELDLIGAEIGDGSRALQGEGGWHRFWFEPSDEPVETDGLTMRIPKNRLIVKDESVPPGRPSPRSARQFASGITANFPGMSQSIRAFRQLQKDAALVILAKWMRDKQIPADEDWVAGQPKPEPTATTTPSITVLRAKLMDEIYLRFGIHGGVDFQKDNRYGAASPQTARLSAALDQSESRGLSSWQFAVDGRPYQAVRLKVSSPVQLGIRWVVWQRIITRVLVQPKPYRLVVPRSDLVVSNETTGSLTIYISGPVTKTENVLVGTPSSIRVVPGPYRLRVVSTSCGTNDDAVTVKEGERHELRYRCEGGRMGMAKGGPAFFTVINNTSAPLTLQINGPINKSEYISTSGPSTVQVVSGSYHLRITSRCGIKEDTVSLAEGDHHELRYWCQPPEQVGSATFLVNNATGASLTVTVAGSTYSVAPGTSTIRLAPGFYTATITSVCGSRTVSLNLSDGTTYTGQYSCVSQ